MTGAETAPASVSRRDRGAWWREVSGRGERVSPVPTPGGGGEARRTPSLVRDGAISGADGRLGLNRIDLI